MNALDALFVPYGDVLSIAEVAAVLGWSEPAAAELVAQQPALRGASPEGVPASALRDFLLQHRTVVRAQPFVPSRPRHLPPLTEVMRSA